MHLKDLKIYILIENIEGLNENHFKTHGRVFEAVAIDWEKETVSVRCPSLITLTFDNVSFNIGPNNEDR